MWLQTRNVRHLVPDGMGPVQTLCGADPAMWFDSKPGRGRFVFSGPRSSAPADMDRPLCSRCLGVLSRLNKATP